VSRLFDRERGARSAALTLAGLGYALAIRGMSFGIASLETKTETLTDLIRVRGLWFYLVLLLDKTPRDSEINNLRNVLNPAVCYQLQP
jgi:hypothetical protein